MRRRATIVLQIIYDDRTHDNPADWSWHLPMDGWPRGDIDVIAGGDRPLPREEVKWEAHGQQ